MEQEVHVHSLANGMTLIAERMPNVRSGAFQLLIPAGASHDPRGQFGLATLVCDMVTRGAGDRSSRELSDAFDRLGVDRGETAGTMNVMMSGAALSRHVDAALGLYADIVRRPHLPADELESAKSLSLQDIESIEDEPQRKVMIELRKRYYPDPLGRDSRGLAEDVEAISSADIRRHFETYYRPNQSILAVAGDIDWPRLRDHVESCFGDWSARSVADVEPAEPTPQSAHIEKDLEQTQIALAWPSVPIAHPDFYSARGAVGVLSQDMSSRLFSNIREKYGLCYSIHAGYESFRDRGTVTAYAGAKPELAQETLDRLLAEFRSLADGIESDEIDRVKIGLKSALIMRQESTAGRASSLAADWYYLGRIRPLAEVQSAVDAITTAGVLKYVRERPPVSPTLVTLGRRPLTLPSH